MPVYQATNPLLTHDTGLSQNESAVESMDNVVA